MSLTARSEHYARHWKECFDFNELSGLLVWKFRPSHHFASDANERGWNKRYAGTVAGNQATGKDRKTPSAVNVSVDGKLIKAHRIIWTICNGPIPDGVEIDHIDGNPWNNKLSNLRLASRDNNCHNTRTRKDNRLGIKCVRQTRSGMFASYIKANGKTIAIGTFSTAEEAHEKYCEMAKLLRGDFCRTK